VKKICPAGEFKYDLTHCKNLSKCHIAPTPSTTIKEKKKKIPLVNTVIKKCQKTLFNKNHHVM
jgi:hypothetical protein